MVFFDFSLVHLCGEAFLLLLVFTTGLCLGASLRMLGYAEKMTKAILDFLPHELPFTMNVAPLCSTANSLPPADDIATQELPRTPTRERFRPPSAYPMYRHKDAESPRALNARCRSRSWVRTASPWRHWKSPEVNESAQGKRELKTWQEWKGMARGNNNGPSESSADHDITAEDGSKPKNLSFESEVMVSDD